LQIFVNIQAPHSLFKEEGYQHREAVFGIPVYNGSISQPVYYADSDLCDPNVDTQKGYPTRPKGEDGMMLPWPSPYILMVDRGSCTLVQKVRNAQQSGAVAVVIADNVCLCSDGDQCSRTNPLGPCQSGAPIMANDGSDSDISIPSFLMFKRDADKVKVQLQANNPVQMEMSWNLTTLNDRYNQWNVLSDTANQDFIRIRAHLRANKPKTVSDRQLLFGKIFDPKTVREKTGSKSNFKENELDVQEVKETTPEFISESNRENATDNLVHEKNNETAKADIDSDIVSDDVTNHMYDDKQDESVKASTGKAKADYFKKFLEIALESGTDKVTDHHYNYAYQQYLPDLRHSPVRFVEIGLGCDMHYGPGKSLDLWDRYFTHKDAQIFFMEYDAICAEKLHLSRPRVSVDAGDQANVTVLNSFIEKHGGNFDIIVDDGGHTMVQQITSLVNLFPALSSGGLYFLEDLQTSYMEQYGGGYLNEKTTIEYIKRMIDGLYGQGSATELIEQVRSIHCFHELCVFIKKDDM